MNAVFRVGITSDALDSNGQPSFGTEPLAILEADPNIAWEYLPERVGAITAEHCARYDAIYVLSASVPAEAVARADCRLRLVARHGVGFDSVDVAAMTAAGVMVTNTPAAVRRPVATMAITYMLALTQKMLVKDRLTRSGRWFERTDHMGAGLTGRTLGVVGAGGIGREFLRMASIFEMRMLAADPKADRADIEALSATLTDLDTLLREADVVVLLCLLDESTHHLINARTLGLMKKSAYLINCARGPIVDEKALYAALAAGRIAGAGLDVFEQEPTPADNPILTLDNVIVSPHALCWTDEMFRGIAQTGLRSVVDALNGRVPKHLVDPAVLRHPRVSAALAGKP